MSRLSQQGLSCGADKETGIAGAVRDLQRMVRSTERLHDMVVESAPMQEIVRRARKFAQTEASVLITGENGTGKELVAELVHLASARSDGPFVRVNCAALPEALFESELFGHEAGAFTGATQARAGRIEFAANGTLLLDEISEISPAVQAKLLRVLEEMEYQRLGSNESLPVKTRVVATSNRALLNEIRAGTFREDLFYRLSALQLEIPPLRDRPIDVPPLVNHFVQRNKSETSTKGISAAAVKRLTAYDWPGNVRQLRNVILHACVMCDTGRIELADLPDLPTSVSQTADDWADLKMEEIERRIITECLSRYDGNKTAAARHLGITSRTIANKLKQYNRAA